MERNTRCMRSMDSYRRPWSGRIRKRARLPGTRRISEKQSAIYWRRGGDSTPRLSFPNTRFRGELFQPLRHLSALDCNGAMKKEQGRRKMGVIESAGCEDG